MKKFFTLNLLQFYFGYEKKSFGDEIGEVIQDNAGMIIFTILLSGILFIVGSLVFLKWMKKSQSNTLGTDDIENYKKICIKVKVVNKVNKTANYTDPFNHIIFEKEDGERLNFALQDVQKYNDIVVGDEGLLTYAGRAFIDFVRISK